MKAPRPALPAVSRRDFVKWAGVLKAGLDDIAAVCDLDPGRAVFGVSLEKFMTAPHRAFCPPSPGPRPIQS